MNKGGSVVKLVWLLFAAMVAYSPLLRDGWFYSHDVISHLDRLFATSYEIGFGHLYPRWLSAAAHGKGLPVLNYYSPAFYLVTGYLNVLGIPMVAVLKSLSFAVFLAGSWGMYLWTRKHCGEIGALLAATLFMFVPYHFVDLYVRGALPEFAAGAFLPYLFHGIDLAFARESRGKGFVLTALVSAAIVFTHNLTAFMILPFALVYFFWRAFAERASVREVLLVALAPLAGAGLSAPYWLPSLMEIGYLAKFEAATAGTYNFAEHFVYPAQLFSSFWGFDLSIPGPHDGMSFQIGRLLLAFVAGSAASLFFPAQKARSFGVLMLVLGIFGVFMTTKASAEIYIVEKPMEFVQFPWRFLGPATLFLAASTAVLADALPKGRFSRGIPPFLLLLALVLSIAFSADQRKVRARMPFDLDAKGKANIEQQNLGVMGVSDEFLPKWVPDEHPIGVKFPPVISKLKVDNLRLQGSTIRFSVDGGEKGGSAVVTQFYFPGWQAEVDGQGVPVGHTPEGFVSLRLPKGKHTVFLRFGTTWPRVTGWLIAALTVLVLVPLWFRRGRSRA